MTAIQIDEKEFYACYDDSEAEEMIAEGLVEMRSHPDNPKRFQYRKKTWADTEMVGKETRTGVDSSSLVDAQEASTVMDALDGMDLVDAMVSASTLTQAIQYDHVMPAQRAKDKNMTLAIEDGTAEDDALSTKTGAQGEIPLPEIYLHVFFMLF